MKFTIDRFEENMAVCITDDNIKFDVPKVFIPYASEGDVYDITFSKLPEERKKRHISIEQKAKRLWAD